MTEHRQITVSGIPVEIVRKDVKNLHVGVYPPEGRVRVAAPLLVDDEAVRLAVVTRLGWIQRMQAQYARQVRQSQREYVSGESHYFQGIRYRLNVIEHDGPPSVRLPGSTCLEMHVRRGSDRDKREAVLDRWYRDSLRAEIPPLMDEWQSILGVEVAEWRIKRMKTRWGSCNADASRIWLNVELAKKPVRCLEYVLVHELVHLRQRTHDERFIAIMDRVMPQWRSRREELNQAPLAHEYWHY